MAEQCFTCSGMAHGISVAKLHRQSLRLLTLAQAVRKRRVQRAAVFSHGSGACVDTLVAVERQWPTLPTLPRPQCLRKTTLISLVRDLERRVSRLNKDRPLRLKDLSLFRSSRHRFHQL